jgi:hypothetical protein
VVDAATDPFFVGEGSAEAYEGYDSTTGQQLSGIGRGIRMVGDIDRSLAITGVLGGVAALAKTARTIDTAADLAKASGGATVLSKLGTGSAVDAATGAGEGTAAACEVYTRVGRWMSEAEFELMVKTGKVQESFTGVTHVAHPRNIAAYEKQAAPRSLYVEFDVPHNSLSPGGSGWASIIGPNSIQGRLAARRGLPIQEMPEALNIEHMATKLLERLGGS